MYNIFFKFSLVISLALSGSAIVLAESQGPGYPDSSCGVLQIDEKMMAYCTTTAPVGPGLNNKKDGVWTVLCRKAGGECGGTQSCGWKEIIDTTTNIKTCECTCITPTPSPSPSASPTPAS